MTETITQTSGRMAAIDARVSSERQREEGTAQSPFKLARAGVEVVFARGGEHSGSPEDRTVPPVPGHDRRVRAGADP